MALRLINPSRKPLLHVPRPSSSSFSSSSSNNNTPPFPPPPPPPSDDPGASPRHPPPNQGEGPQRPAASSIFLDIRERLKSSPAPPPPRRIPANPLRPGGPPAAPSVGLDDIKRSLESFRAVSPRLSGPGAGGGGANPSFQDLLKKSAAAPAAGRPQGGAPNAGDGKPFSFSFDSIRESIRKIDPQQERQRQPPLRFLNNTPDNIFGREMRQRAGKPQPGEGKEDEDAGISLLNQYTPEELGQKLRELRPADAGKDGKEWFSLQELQGRIAKIAEQERSQADTRLGGEFGLLRQTIGSLQNNQKELKEEKKRVRTVQHMSLFANIGGKPLPEYMLSNLPLQEELLERYFHPDHMSGEEKMKLELQKVRDEFKMSENDCGSARVQIAQLTLKIKHLSSVLHKKDKHSRKGLQDMVQRRKKYLKYLRRTDWDSYCLVLSKLGLRDTPEYKAPDYKKTQPTKAQLKKSKSKRKRKMKV